MNAIATLEFNYGFQPTRGALFCRNDERGAIHPLELTPTEVAILKKRKVPNAPMVMATRCPKLFLRIKQFLRQQIN